MSKRFLIALSVLVVVTLLLNNHAISLWDEDEAAYAGFALEMWESGNWVVPEYPWSVIHRKTPLHFWLMGGSYALFGVNEWAVRWSSALAILLTCWLVYAWGKPLYGRMVAQQAALILATTIQVPLMGKIAFTDATLLCTETAALLALLNYLNAPHWRWNLALWGSLALGVLAKGPPILVLVGGVWVLLALWHPQRKRLVGTHPWFLGPLALVPFGAWCYAAYSHDYQLWEQVGQGQPFGEWWQQEDGSGRKVHLLPFLWDWYVLKRIGGAVLGQSGFPGYHLVVVLVAFLTWLPLLFWTFRGVVLGVFRSKMRSPLLLPLLCWLAMGWWFWELMSSKLPSYALGAHPALALGMALLGQSLPEQPLTNVWVKIGVWLHRLIFGGIALALPVAGYQLLGAWTLWYLTPFSLVLLALLVTFWRKPPTYDGLLQQTALFGAVFMFGLWAAVAPVIEQSPIKALDDVVDTAQTLVPPGTKPRVILTGLDLKQHKISLLFYAQQQFGSYEKRNQNEAWTAYQDTSQTIVLIMGTEGIGPLQEMAGARAFDPIQVPYRSTDDQLKRHDFWVICNGGGARARGRD